jgi:hypothetical protein
MNLSSELLFILLCFPLRIIISILPNSELLVGFFNKIKIKINTNIFYRIFGIILLLISLGFLYLFFSNKRLRAGEAGGKTWWHNLRLFHGMMYLCASIYILKNIGNNNLIKYASIPLICDVIVGFIAFVNYRFLKKY